MKLCSIDPSKWEAAETKGDVLLICSLDDCLACQEIKQAFEDIEDGIFDCIIYYVNYDTLDSDVGEFLQKLSVEAFPSLIHLRNGNEVCRWGGFFEKESRQEKVQLLQEALIEQLNSV